MQKYHDEPKQYKGYLKSALEDGFGLRLKQAEQIGQPVGGSSYQVGAEHSRGAEEAEDDVRELSDTSLLTDDASEQCSHERPRKHAPCHRCVLPPVSANTPKNLIQPVR